jgi:hypothetical protein
MDIEVEGNASRLTESKDERQDQAVVKKESIVASYRALVAFYVKQFSFDIVPLGESEEIYSSDAIKTLKN